MYEAGENWQEDVCFSLDFAGRGRGRSSCCVRSRCYWEVKKQCDFISVWNINYTPMCYRATGSRKITVVLFVDKMPSKSRTYYTTLPELLEEPPLRHFTQILFTDV